MKFQTKIREQKGMTLVEILAAIVILSIVLISFSSFFIQSAKNTKYNEKKLTAIEVGEEVVAEIRSVKTPVELYDFKQSPTNPEEYVNETTYPYKVTITIDKKPEIELTKAIVRVKSADEKDLFTTEMYFE